MDDDYEFLYDLNKRTMRDYAEQTYGAWDEAVSRRIFAERWHPETIKIVQIDGQDGGMLEMIPSETGIWLANIRVAPEYQNQGIGAQLVSGVLEEKSERHRAGLVDRRVGGDRLLGRVAMLADQLQDRERMRPITRLHDQVQPDLPDPGVRPQPVDADVDDVDPLSREQAGQVVQAARLIVQPGPNRQVSSGAGEPLLEHLAKQVRIDVAAADDHADPPQPGR